MPPTQPAAEPLMVTQEPPAAPSAVDVESASPTTTWTLDMLPPLPKPDYALKNIESRRGVFTVLWIIAWCVGLTHGVGLTVGKIEGNAWWVVFSLLYGLTTIALICLVGVLCTDPGTIKRSEETCFPLPAQVEQRLREGRDPFDGLTNVTEGDRTFCVRCLVWRPPADPRKTSARGLFGPALRHCAKAQPHHCRTCQRCVVHFDHHCGVFGRCIAGYGLSGNMKYFTVIICAGYLGAILTIGAVLGGLFSRLSQPGGWDA